MVTEPSPHMDSSPLGHSQPPLQHQQPTVQNTRYRLSLAKASNFDWLTRDRHAMRDLTAIAKEGSHWVPIQDLPFDEIILFAMQPTTHLDPRMSAFRPVSCAQRSNSAAIRTQSRGNAYLAFTSLMAGEYDPGWTFRPTCLGRGIHPSMMPEHDSTPTAEPPQTPDEEARDILSKAIRNQAEDGPSTRRAAILASMRPPKNTPHAAKQPRKTSNTGLNRKNSLLSHRNSRLSCYTACPPCLTPGPWLKSQSGHGKSMGIKNRKTFFCG